MPRYNKGNIKSRKVNTRVSAARTRKNVAHAKFMDRKEQIRQAAIAAMIVDEQVMALQAAGLVPLVPAAAPAAAGAAAAAAGAAAAAVEPAVNPDNQLIELPLALAILHNAADNAADPVPLHRAIAAQGRRAGSRPCIMYTIASLRNIFIGLAISYYSSFPFHAAPKETSIFDTAATHLSLAGTAAGFLKMPNAGVILSSCAATAKIAGKAVRNYNAASGRFPNAPGNAARRALNAAEYIVPFASPLGIARVAGIGVGLAIDAATGKPVEVEKVGEALVLSSFADVAVNIGSKLGKSNENTLEETVSALGLRPIVAHGEKNAAINNS
jgi:hypothetical protein